MVSRFPEQIALSGSITLKRKLTRSAKVPVEPAGAARDQSRSWREPALRPRVRVAILVALVVTLTVAYWAVERTISFNSDNACVLLQAEDVAAGNLALRGWTLSNCSFYPESSFYALALLLNHSARSLAREGPPFIYAIIVIIALWLTGRGVGDPARCAGYVITFLLIALPGSLQHLFIAPSTHMSTLLLVLAAVVTLSFGEKPSDRPCAIYFIYIALMAFAVFGDLFAVYVGAIPVAAVAAYRWVQSRFSHTRELAVLAATIVAVLIGNGSLEFVRAMGGFHIVPIDAHFVAMRSLRSNAWATIAGIAALFGVSLEHGTAMPLGAILVLARLAGLLFLLLCCSIAAHRTLRGTENRTNEILLAVIALDVLEYLLSDRAEGLETLRYLTPLVLFGAILAGRVGNSLLRPTRGFYAALGLISIAYLAGFSRLIIQPVQSAQKDSQLAQWLYQHGLVSGYGDYWQSSIVTLESDGKVKVRAVGFNGRLIPYLWESKDQWYSAKSGVSAPNFVVFENQKYLMDIFREVSAVRTLGKPSQTFQFQTFTIMIWDHGKWLLGGTE